MMEVTESLPSAIVYGENQSGLSVEEAVNILQQPQSSKISFNVAHSPQAGQMFLYSSEHKVTWQSDGHNWRNCGKHNLPYKQPVCKKSYYRETLPGQQSPMRREVYTSLDSKCKLILVHYLPCVCTPASTYKQQQSTTAEKLHVECISAQEAQSALGQALFVNDCEFSFELSWTEFQSIRSSSNSTKLSPNVWCDIFYKHFHEAWPECSLSFQNNHIRKPDSKRINSAFIKAYAKCKVSNCIKVIFTVRSEPVTQGNVVVDVKVDKKCIHDSGTGPDDVPTIHKRQLTGDARKEIAVGVSEGRVAPTNLYLTKVSNMNENELVAGNVTDCQNPQVFKQAAYEYKKSTLLCDDPIQELKIAKKSLRAAIGNKVKGYIQDISLTPFCVSFYMEDQVEIFVKNCGRGNNTVLHLDATGSIISRIPDEGPPYYYCLLMGELNLPVLEFLSTSHTAFRICGVLKEFLYNCRVFSPGSLLQPSVIVTDFSLALIYAVIEAFNKMSLISYLTCTFEILNGKSNEIEITSLTFLAMCCAHMLKTISRRLVRCENRKKVRQAVMVMFARLQRCSGLLEAERIYKSIYVLLNSPKCNAEVKNARFDILPAGESDRFKEMSEIETAAIKADSENVNSNLTGDNWSDSEDVNEEMRNELEVGRACNVIDTHETIASQSPFTNFFRNSVDGMEIAQDGVSQVNDLYSPMAFNCIKSLMYIFPLWSSALHGNQVRFGSKNESEYVPRCESNAIIESHFGVVKGKTLHYKRNRPLEFILKELTQNKGKVKETFLPVPSKEVRKRARGPEPEEYWRKSKKKTKPYHHEQTVKQILFSNTTKEVSSVTLKTKTQRQGVKSKKILAVKKGKDNGQYDNDFIATEPVTLPYDEFSDEHLATAMDKLYDQFSSSTSGLQSPGLGQCEKMGSLPRFRKSNGKRFVQVMNDDCDHWICVTNVFGNSTTDVYVFDSLYARVTDTIVLQVSSLMRDDDTVNADLGNDTITFHLRKFDVQSTNTRLCGFFALAAAVSCCMRIDPTGNAYDENQLIKSCNDFLLHESEITAPFPCVSLDAEEETVSELSKPMLYCLCHEPYEGRHMAQCTICANWYHVQCVFVPKSSLNNASEVWRGPCCSKKKKDNAVSINIDQLQSQALNCEAISKEYNQPSTGNTEGSTKSHSNERSTKLMKQLNAISCTESDVTITGIEEKSKDRRVSNRIEKENALTDFILQTPAVKEHIKSVLVSADNSEEAYRYRRQRMSKGERRAQNCKWMGPLQEDSSYFKLFKFVRRIGMESVQKTTNDELYSLKNQMDAQYMVDVLMFEAIVFGLCEMNGINRKEAEVIFEQDHL